MDENTRILIEQLAAKLGTTADHVWTILIAQAKVSSIANTVIAPLILIAAVIIIKYLNKLHDEDEYDVLPSVGKILTVVFAIILIPVCVYSAIVGFLNPEYWALAKIMEIVQ